MRGFCTDAPSRYVRREAGSGEPLPALGAGRRVNQLGDSMSFYTGTWDTKFDTIFGEVTLSFTLGDGGGHPVCTVEYSLGPATGEVVKVTGNTIEIALRVSKPVPLSAPVTLTFDGDTFTGYAKARFLPGYEFPGTRRVIAAA